MLHDTVIIDSICEPAKPSAGLHQLSAALTGAWHGLEGLNLLQHHASPLENDGRIMLTYITMDGWVETLVKHGGCCQGHCGPAVFAYAALWWY